VHPRCRITSLATTAPPRITGARAGSSEGIASVSSIVWAASHPTA